jgi:hypothetical protein
MKKCPNDSTSSRCHGEKIEGAPRQLHSTTTTVVEYAVMIAHRHHSRNHKSETPQLSPKRVCLIYQDQRKAYSPCSQLHRMLRRDPTYMTGYMMSRTIHDFGNGIFRNNHENVPLTGQRIRLSTTRRHLQTTCACDIMIKSNSTRVEKRARPYETKE